MWDNKFGMITDHEESDDLTDRAREQREARDMEYILNHSTTTNLYDKYKREEIRKEFQKVIDGVGADAEVVTNDKGGMQSKAPMAMHLIDPTFLEEWAGNKADDSDKEIYNCYKAIEYIARFMENTDIDNDNNLQRALDYLCDDSIEAIISIARVLQYGASRYKANNWRLIPQEEHINHALIHLVAQLAGDRQDKHIDHALCRIMMASATKKSDDFEYDKYVDTNKY